jgi:hypothetical protein
MGFFCALRPHKSNDFKHIYALSFNLLNSGFQFFSFGVDVDDLAGCGHLTVRSKTETVSVKVADEAHSQSVGGVAAANALPDRGRECVSERNGGF